MQRELAVAAALNAERIDDIDRRGAEHLVFLVGERDRRSDDDAVAGVHADRIEVLHRADRDRVAEAVADHLKFDFLPARDALFNEDLRDRREREAVRRDLHQLLAVADDAAAGAAERECRADDDRIRDLLGELQRVLHRGDDLRGNAGLIDALHRILEDLAVLGLIDRLRRGAEQTDVVLFEKALLRELHRKREAGLAAEAGKDAVRLFLFDDALDRGQRERLNIDVVCHGVVGHDRRRVRVDEDDLDAVRLEGAAGLRARVVEFRSLTDHDRAGADDKNFLDVFIQWHSCKHSFLYLRGFCIRSGGGRFPQPARRSVTFSSCRRTGRTGRMYRRGRRRPPGGTARRTPGYSCSGCPRRSYRLR